MRKIWIIGLICCLAAWGCAPVEEGTGVGGSEVEEADSNVTLQEPATIDQEALTLVKVSVPGMSCAEGCPPVVRVTLASCQGVQDVNVDFDSKTATIHVTEDDFDSTAALAALAEVGFEDSTLLN